LVRTGDEDAADVGVGVERLDRAEELVPQGGVERIERLRPVETHDADAPAPFDYDGLRSHGGPLLSFRPPACTAPPLPKPRPATGAAERRSAAPVKKNTGRRSGRPKVGGPRTDGSTR